MSSPASDASSSRDSLDDNREQSTKDRRRERNRLAAQKHRLRRNERMSQLEQQVLALQQEKSQLLSQLENLGAAAVAASASAPSAAAVPFPLDPELEMDIPPRAKRARTATSADRDHLISRVADSPHPQLYQDTIRRMEERIVELERWSEDLNGDLADALDSESRLKHELRQTTHHADAHTRRLTDALHASETTNARHVRDIADLRDALDAEAASARTLRDANHRLRESLEGAEVTLGIQRVENERLRDCIAEEDSKAATKAARLEDELADARQALADVQEENRRLRKVLREQESMEDAAAEARQRQKERAEGEQRRGEEREAAAKETIESFSSRLGQFEARYAKQSRQLEAAEAQAASSERERWKLEERVGSLQSSLEKVGAFLASKGIPIDVE